MENPNLVPSHLLWTRKTCIILCSQIPTLSLPWTKSYSYNWPDSMYPTICLFSFLNTSSPTLTTQVVHRFSGCLMSMSGKWNSWMSYHIEKSRPTLISLISLFILTFPPIVIQPLLFYIIFIAAPNGFHWVQASVWEVLDWVHKGRALSLL